MQKGTLYFLLGVAYSILLTLSVWGSWETGYNIWMLVVALFVVHAINAPQTVGADELAVTDCFGQLSEHLKSGLHLVPYPVVLHKVTKNDIKVDFGTLDESERKKILDSADSTSWFVMEEAIRIHFGDIRSTSGLSSDERKLYENDPLSSRITTDPHLFFIFRVYDLRKLRTIAGGLHEAVDRIKDTCVTTLTEEAGQTFVSRATTNLNHFTEKMFGEVSFTIGDPSPDVPATKGTRKKGDSWGVDLREVRIKSLGLPHLINTAIAKRSSMIAESEGSARATVIQSEADETKAVNLGRGEAQKTVFEGDAKAHVIKATGKAEAEALAKRAKASQKPGGEIMAKLDAWKVGMEHGKVVILPADGTLMTEVLKASTAVTASKT